MDPGAAFDYLLGYPRLMLAAAPMLALLDPLLVESAILPMVAAANPEPPRRHVPRMRRVEFAARYPGCRMNSDQLQVVAIAQVDGSEVVVTTRGIWVYRGGRLAMHSKLRLDPSRSIYFGSGLFSGCGQSRGSELTFRVCNLPDYGGIVSLTFEPPLPGNTFAYRLSRGSAYCYKSCWVMFHPGFPGAQLELKLDPLFDDYENACMCTVEVVREIPCTHID